jgi:hypothetical protein
VLVDGVVDVVHAFRVFVSEASGLLDRLGGLSNLTVVPMLFTPRRYIDYSSIDSIYAVVRGYALASDPEYSYYNLAIFGYVLRRV